MVLLLVPLVGHFHHHLERQLLSLPNHGMQYSDVRGCHNCPALFVDGISGGTCWEHLRHAYEVKYIAALKQNEERSHLWGSPLFVHEAEIQIMLDYYGKECGFKSLSEENFLTFVLFASRHQAVEKLKKTHPHLDEQSPEVSAINVMDLCEVSKMLVKKVAAIKLKEISRTMSSSASQGKCTSSNGKPKRTNIPTSHAATAWEM